MRLWLLTQVLLSAGCHLVFPHGGTGIAPRDGAGLEGRRDAETAERASDGPRRDGDGPRSDGPRSDSGVPPGAVCSTDRWCWENPKPLGNRLHGVWASGPNDVYVVGERGTILHLDGTKLLPMDSGTTADLNGIWGSSPTDIVAVGDGGLILRYGGGAWAPDTSTFTDTLWAVWGRSSKDVFAVGENGRIVHFDGSAWASQKDTGSNLFGVSGDATHVFAVGENGEIWSYAGNWSKSTPTTKRLYSVWVSSSTFAMAVGVQGISLIFDGAKWLPPPAPGGPSAGALDLFAVSGTSPSEVTVVGQSGAAWRYNNSPSTWSKLSSGTGLGLEAVWPAGAETFVVGDGGTFLRYNSTWQRVGSGAQDDLYGVISQHGLTAAVGVGGRLLWRQGWQSWTLGDTGVTGEFLEGLWALNATTMIVSGGAGTILTCPTGQPCAPFVKPTQAGLDNLWGLASGAIFAVGATTSGAGAVLYYNGTSWSPVQGVSGRVHGVWADDAAGDAYVVGDGGTILRCTSTSCTLVAKPVPDNLHAIWGRSATELFAVGDAGTIVERSGAAWDAKPSGTAVTLWDVAGCGTEVYAVGAEGTILRKSGASAWSTALSPTKNDLFGVWCQAPGEVYAVGKHGTILHRFAP